MKGWRSFLDTKKSCSKQIIISIILILCGIMFLLKASFIAEGIKNGLSICGNMIIPSLFCFFILTNFITLSGLNKIISIPLAPITKHLFHLDSHLGCVILMSMVGGYPIGAKAIASLLEQKKISHNTALRMISFCCNAGPSFVITAVGIGLFANQNIGFALYKIQLVSAVIMGIIVSIGKRPEASLDSGNSSKDLGTAFVEAVNSSVNSIIQMCGYILFFSAVLSLIKLSPLPQKYMLLLSGFLEVTTGCISAASLPGILGFVSVSFFIAFGGVSVLFQVGSMLKNSNISVSYLFCCQFVRGIIAAILSYLYIRINPQIISVFSNSNLPQPVMGQNTPILTLCLLMMCSILLLSIGTSRNPRQTY